MQHLFFGVFCIFGQNYSLGTGNSSNLIEISLSGDNKTKVWGKFVVKISREGTKEVSKCHTFALTPPSPSKHWYWQNEICEWKRKHNFLTF